MASFEVLHLPVLFFTFLYYVRVLWSVEYRPQKEDHIIILTADICYVLWQDSLSGYDEVSDLDLGKILWIL